MSTFDFSPDVVGCTLNGQWKALKEVQKSNVYYKILLLHFDLAHLSSVPIATPIASGRQLGPVRRLNATNILQCSRNKLNHIFLNTETNQAASLILKRNRWQEKSYKINHERFWALSQVTAFIINTPLRRCDDAFTKRQQNGDFSYNSSYYTNGKIKVSCCHLRRHYQVQPATKPNKFRRVIGPISHHHAHSIVSWNGTARKLV